LPASFICGMNPLQLQNPPWRQQISLLRHEFNCKCPWAFISIAMFFKKFGETVMPSSKISRSSAATVFS
jgi:hypothetical protein